MNAENRPKITKKLEELHHEYTAKKRLSVIIWIIIFAVAIIGIILVFIQMQQMGNSSMEISRRKGMKFVSKDGKTMYEHKYPDYTIDEDGNIIPIDITPEYKKKWMISLLLALIITSVVFIIIIIGTNQNKKLIKELTHIEFEIEREKYSIRK